MLLLLRVPHKGCQVMSALLVGSEEHKPSETDPGHAGNEPSKQPAGRTRRSEGQRVEKERIFFL